MKLDDHIPYWAQEHHIDQIKAGILESISEELTYYETLDLSSVIEGTNK